MTPECEHSEHEDCMFCVHCGRCSESLNDRDECSDCVTCPECGRDENALHTSDCSIGNPEDDEREWLNHYRCPACEYQWADVWTAQPDDDCPKCGTPSITPFYSEEITDA